MIDLGQFALLLGLYLSGYAVVIDVLGCRQNDLGLIKSGRNATFASLICLTIAMIVLWVLLIQSDFRVTYVAEHTSKALPLAYKISALWAGSAGSLLLWLWLQVGFAVFVFCRSRRENMQFCSFASVGINLVSVIFFIILVKDRNPFALSVVTGPDGYGLNPLLQHPAMVLHPPILFVGYAGFAISFAWALSALIFDNKQHNPLLFAQARNWTLWAWLFLTVGIVLGAWWAYEELSWGGYWAWDPVENASLLPWLTGTALLHCFRIYKRRSSIETWTVVLSLLTFSLCIFGRFVTKYLGALLASVHAFAEKGLGILYLVLLVVIWVLAAVLMWKKYSRDKLSGFTKIKAGPGFVIWNNCLMLLLTLVILVGTIYPVLSGFFSDEKASLKSEFFTNVTAPLGLVLLLFLALCPYLLRKGINKNWRIFIAAIAVIAAITVWSITKTVALAYFIICAFGLLNLAADMIDRGMTRARSQNDKPQPINFRWYGSRIVHTGVVLMFIGIAGSSGYSLDQRTSLMPGEAITIAGFNITYNDLSVDHGSTFTGVTANMSVYRVDGSDAPDKVDLSTPADKKLLTKMKPAQAVYSATGKRTSEVDIRRTLISDLYLALTDVDASSKRIGLQVFIKPLINWIWIGSCLMVLGTLAVLGSLYRSKWKQTASANHNKEMR